MTRGQANYVFFPLYPLLMRALGSMLGSFYIAGLLISNAAFLLALAYLFKLAERRFGRPAAYRSVKYAVLFPVGFIFSGVFSEALFLLFLLMSFYYADRDDWLRSGAAGFAMSLARPVGVLMLLPLALVYWHKRNGFKHTRPDILYLSLIPAGAGVFLYYVHVLTGSVWNYLSVKRSGWGHVLSEPLGVLSGGLTGGDINHFLNSLFVCLALAALLVFYKRIGWPYALAGLLFILTPLATGPVSLNSMLRYLLPVFPLYLLFGYYSQNKAVDTIAVPVLAFLQALFMIFWSNGFPLVV